MALGPLTNDNNWCSNPARRVNKNIEAFIFNKPAASYDQIRIEATNCFCLLQIGYLAQSRYINRKRNYASFTFVKMKIGRLN